MNRYKRLECTCGYDDFVFCYTEINPDESGRYDQVDVLFRCLTCGQYYVVHEKRSGIVDKYGGEVRGYEESFTEKNQ